MKSISKMMTASAAGLSTLVLVTMAAPAAHAGEYCSTNTSGMRGCGFATLEQCQASISGISATCARDPFYKPESNAMAYHPKQAHPRSTRHAAKQPVD